MMNMVGDGEGDGVAGTTPGEALGDGVTEGEGVTAGDAVTGAEAVGVTFGETVGVAVGDAVVFLIGASVHGQLQPEPMESVRAPNDRKIADRTPLKRITDSPPVARRPLSLLSQQPFTFGGGPSVPVRLLAGPAAS
jgi:hypothetical protein